ncbi:MAG: hypothetical protein IT499_15350 [Rubrivivax sp.]|nr:hypothetical protein [Rubrivivax sp.]MCL4697180.1 hypothetical protein [Burkholderiaceae bacterium]
MAKVLAAGIGALWCALAGCAAVPPAQHSASPCSVAPAGYDCQIERYQRAPG